MTSRRRLRAPSRARWQRPSGSCTAAVLDDRLRPARRSLLPARAALMSERGGRRRVTGSRCSSSAVAAAATATATSGRVFVTSRSLGKLRVFGIDAQGPRRAPRTRRLPSSSFLGDGQDSEAGLRQRGSAPYRAGLPPRQSTTPSAATRPTPESTKTPFRPFVRRALFDSLQIAHCRVHLPLWLRPRSPGLRDFLETQPKNSSSDDPESACRGGAHVVASRPRRSV